MVQTRTPEHEVIQAALPGRPRSGRHGEAGPAALAALPARRHDGRGRRGRAAAYVERVGPPPGVVVQGPDDGRWLVRAEDRSMLWDHLATVERPPGRLRLRVDPARLP